jgi:hypothetical protein
MVAMFTSLKGGPLWAALIVVLAAVGAVTYLASAGHISGADALIVITAVVTAVTGVASAHVAGNTAAAAFNTPAPAPGVSAPPVPAPATGPSEKVI